jgi:hypothetical protein
MRHRIRSNNKQNPNAMHLNYKIVSTFRPGEGKGGRKLWFPKLTGPEAQYQGAAHQLYSG